MFRGIRSFMSGNIHFYVISATFLAFSFALVSNFLIFNLAYAEEAKVQVIVENDPPVVDIADPITDTIIPEDETIPDTTINYENAKVIKVTLEDPEGNLIVNDTYDITYSPDPQQLTLTWQNTTLTTPGKYIMRVTSVGTDGSSTDVEEVVFYYIEKTDETDSSSSSSSSLSSTSSSNSSASSGNNTNAIAVPNTGTFSIFGLELNRQDFLLGVLAFGLVLGLGLFCFVNRKGGRRGK